MVVKPSDEARQALAGAVQQARSLYHRYLGTEHLLLSLLEMDGPVAEVLGERGVTYSAAREQVVEAVGKAAEPYGGPLPTTAGIKEVTRLGSDEAERLGDDRLGTGHLLLAILAHGEGVAVQILQRLGGDLGEIRERITQAMTGSDDGRSPDTTA